MVSHSPPLPLLWRIFWRAVCAAVVAVAIVWWWAMPGGFPIGHSRFFLHRVTPFALVAVSVTASVSLFRGHTRLAAACLIAFPASWLGGAFAARVLYPESAAAFFPALVIAGSGMLALVLFTFLRRLRETGVALAVAFVAASIAGAGFSGAFRADDADTHPLGAGAGTLKGEAEEIGMLRLTSGGRHVTVDPILRFQSCSADRFMTLFAPRWLCDGMSSGRARAKTGPGGAIDVEAVTQLDGDVFSHLNSFATIAAGGLFDVPSISFSATGAARIEIVAGQYPVGAPYRAAYLGDDGIFRVVEARNAEKGPFREIASGPLRRGDPLTVTLHDGDVPFLEITFDDWSAQASTSLSPTAGWGFPVNSIQFDRNGSSVDVFATLANTSMGRGFDSVGHRAGVYRNRMRVRVP